MNLGSKKGLVVLHLLGAGAGIVWVVAKTPALARGLTAEGEFAHGDLYRDCPIADFALPFPSPMEGWISPPASDSDVLVVGDSFSEVHYGHPPLPAMLASRLSRPVALERNSDPNPLHLTLPSPDRTRRLVVLEVVERYLTDYFGPKALSARRVPSALKQFALSKRDWAFMQNDRQVTFLMTRNPWARPLVEWSATARYRILGEACVSTALFSAEPPMLFLNEESDQSERSFFHEHPPALVANIARSIGVIQASLRSQGLEFIFVPVPNKMTIYRDLVTDVPYDDFVPRVVEALRQGGVCVIDLLPTFQELRRRGETVYYATDTHWTRVAVERAVGMIASAAEGGCSKPAPP